MALKIEGTIEYEGKTYEATGEMRNPNCGEWFLADTGSVIKSSGGIFGPRVILREAKPEPKYKAGDWVRVIESRYDILAGTKAEIKKVDAQGHYWLDGSLTPKQYPNGTCWVGREFEAYTPKYRPFSSAEEFKPHRDRWLRYKHGTQGARVNWVTDDAIEIGKHRILWTTLFHDYVFDDTNEPCGVKE